MCIGEVEVGKGKKRDSREVMLLAKLPPSQVKVQGEPLVGCEHRSNTTVFAFGNDHIWSSRWTVPFISPGALTTVRVPLKRTALLVLKLLGLKESVFL